MSVELLSSSDQDTEEQWISISDMMAGLMVIFLFIAISYMIYVQAEKEKIEQIAVTYEKLQSELYADLKKEFEKDLDRWDAILDRQTLSVRFREPEVLFAQGQAEVRPVFKRILDDFFPRYIQILRQSKYIHDVAEIRIEGHTSSEWIAGVDSDKAYINNMELSQGRTRSVLEYVLQIQSVKLDRAAKEWLTGFLTANGLSSSKSITNSDGSENREESRRVEFRVRTNAEKRIVEIIRRGVQE